MENIYRRLEAWGYPVAATDWLRRRRLLVIAILAVLAWLCSLAVFFAVFYLGSHLLNLVGGFFLTGH